ncbi:S8 family serine peptidase [Tissierella praeacuta]|uniref:S8 family serine peptidase n=1 Tax=Tissierella praeacuta TaxID=43131 RepID=UPI00333F913E
MKKIFSLLMIMVMLVTIGMPSFAKELKDQMDSVIPGELIVSIEKTDIESRIQSINSRTENHIDVINNGEFEVESSLISSLFDDENKVSSLKSNDFMDTIIDEIGYVYLVKYENTDEDVQEVIEKLREYLEESGLKVNYIEPNYEVEADEDNLAEELDDMNVTGIHNSQYWHYNMIGIPKAWDISEGSRNVRVAVIDTGIQYTHPNLADFVDRASGKNFTTSDSYDFMDRAGHGTHVAGTIASYGQVSGVMKYATLIPIKVLNDRGSGTTYDIMQGLLHAGNVNADVANLSIRGWGYSESMNQACETVTSRGLIVVAATGNDYRNEIGYPARYKSVIAIGAVDEKGKRADFSNYGTGGVDVMAPGVKIYSTYPNSDFALLSGTSMATPHVAGVAGLMKSVNKNITPEQARRILKDTATYAGPANEYGAGIVNAYEAIKSVR